MTPATTAWEHLTHGFQLSGVLQYYSALPFNITSGVTTVQGTAGRPIVDGAFIPRNAGVGARFLQPQPAAQPRRSDSAQRVRRGSARRGVQPDESRERRARINGNFGSGAYPTNPSPKFGQITAVGDPRTLQFGVRCQF